MAICDEGWSLFSNACYKFNPERKDWKEAANTCEQAGGHLTSIHSQDELAFIRMLMDSSKVNIKDSTTWIGGERNGNSFRWIDGTSFDFDNWNELEPNNEGENENCIEVYTAPGYIRHNKFNDKACNLMDDFICKKQPMEGTYSKRILMYYLKLMMEIVLLYLCEFSRFLSLLGARRRWLH